MSHSSTVVVATRRSPLARAQTREAIEFLSVRMPGVAFEERTFSTEGDERLEWSLEAKGGKGLFTSELERALSAGEADLAVHSSKDLPTELPDGLALAGFLPREPAEDVLVLRDGVARVRRLATGSPRRRAQIGRFFPDVEWTEIRGNVGTRLDKVADGAADGTVMALAGLRRLGIRRWKGLVFQPLGVRQCVPAAGQGAIAVECRAGDAALWAPFLCAATAHAVGLERLALSAMGGGCHAAAAAHVRGGRLHVFEESVGTAAMDLPREGARDAVARWLRGLLGGARV
ncbi:MAG: hydroxymethylbilane synthase [Opitutales bacterium]|nr:hydroxymethylbilane synthase [Opitutales bacterium]